MRLGVRLYGLRGDRLCEDCAEYLMHIEPPDPAAPPSPGDTTILEAVSSEPHTQNGEAMTKTATTDKERIRSLKLRIDELKQEADSLKISHRRIHMLGKTFERKGCDYARKKEFWKLFFALHAKEPDGVEKQES